jgi:hypothetical protein
MLKVIYTKGYGTKIHQLYCSQDKTEVAAFLSELRNKLGFDMDMLGKVLYAFSLPVQKVGKQKLYDYKHEQIKRTIEACQLEIDANSVAEVNIEYTMSSQIKNPKSNKWEYIITRDNVICSDYILERNEKPLIYLKNLLKESPNAIYLRRGFVDTMPPDLVTNDKYRHIFKLLMDAPNGIHYNRYIIFVKIKRELLDDSKPFSRDYLRYKDFQEFLEINNWLNTQKEERVSNMDKSVREIAMCFIDALENANLDYLIPKVLTHLENISKTK